MRAVISCPLSCLIADGKLRMIRLEDDMIWLSSRDARGTGPAGALFLRKVGGVGRPPCRREDECGII